jgi:hypothetical protein
MRAVLNTCIVVIFVNVLILVGVYGTGAADNGQDTTQSLSRLISGYAEPSSNPQFLVRDENQCRFWTTTIKSGYCARALAKRKAIVAAYSFTPSLPEVLKATPHYAAYVETRKALTISTNEYISFLSTNPPDAVYIDASKQFEEQTQVLVGQLIGYLYDMQSQTIAKQSGSTQAILMMQYFSMVALMFLVCFLRFRRGGVTNG